MKTVADIVIYVVLILCAVGLMLPSYGRRDK